jgi:hypothetical protein
MSTNTKSKKKKSIPKAVGMWKDRWPKDVSSKEIAREIRKEQWKRD